MHEKQKPALLYLGQCDESVLDDFSGHTESLKQIYAQCLLNVII